MPIQPKSHDQLLREQHPEFVIERKTAAQRGYTGRWHRARKIFLQKNPLCVHCLAEGKTTEATVVDHVIPHRGNRFLFWDEGNWQPLCVTHHGVKTGAGL